MNNRLVWLAARRSGRRRWTPLDVAHLKQLVGQFTPLEMARALGRPLTSITSKLQQLGYRLSADVIRPLGLSAIGLARHCGVTYDLVYREIQAGHIPTRRVGPTGKKDFLIAWKEVRRFERVLNRRRQRYERAKAKITELTISKQAFMRLVGLSETHAHRYLVGRVVKAWKLPARWTDIGAWEWRVSQRDAHRIARLRRHGRLKLNQPAYRRLQQATNTEVTRLRRERRLGTRPAYGARRCVVPGRYTVAEVAQIVGRSETAVRAHIQLGRLKVKPVQVGRHKFQTVTDTQLRKYQQWCQREQLATGPLRPRQKQKERIWQAGYLTITDAALKYGLGRGMLNAAVHRGAVPSVLIAGLRAVTAHDMRRYVRQLQWRNQT